MTTESKPKQDDTIASNNAAQSSGGNTSSATPRFPITNLVKTKAASKDTAQAASESNSTSESKSASPFLAPISAANNSEAKKNDTENKEPIEKPKVKVRKPLQFKVVEPTAKDAKKTEDKTDKKEEENVSMGLPASDTTDSKDASLKPDNEPNKKESSPVKVKLENAKKAADKKSKKAAISPKDTVETAPKTEPKKAAPLSHSVISPQTLKSFSKAPRAQFVSSRRKGLFRAWAELSTIVRYSIILLAIIVMHAVFTSLITSDVAEPQYEAYQNDSATTAGVAVENTPATLPDVTDTTTLVNSAADEAIAQDAAEPATTATDEAAPSIIAIPTEDSPEQLSENDLGQLVSGEIESPTAPVVLPAIVTEETVRAAAEPLPVTPPAADVAATPASPQRVDNVPPAAPSQPTITAPAAGDNRVVKDDVLLRVLTQQ